MNLETLSQKKPVVLGLMQSVLALAYVAIMASFFQLMERADFEPPELLAAMIMLTLFVVSATIMGLIVFGVSTYLVRKDNWSKALQILGFTVLFSFMVIAILLAVVFAIQG